MKKRKNIHLIKVLDRSLMIIPLSFLFLSVAPYVYAGIFGSCNFYECILDDMPGVKNDIVARQIVSKCSSECTDMSTKKKFSIGFSGKITAQECVVKYAKDTNSEVGARLIFTACYSLYPEK